MVVRAEGAEAIEARPTPPVLVKPVARVQVAPLSDVHQTWPSVVPVVAAGLASRVRVKLLPPPQAMSQT